MANELTYWFAFSMPMFAALYCAVFCLLHYFSSEKNQDRTHILLMVGSLFCGFSCWLGGIIYLAYFQSFIYYVPIFFLVLMFDQVMLYHAVFCITKTEPGKGFRPLHYVIPALLCVIYTVSSLFVPRGVQEQIFLFDGSTLSSYPYFSSLFFLMLIVVWSYCLFYVPLGLCKLKKYRIEIVNYATDPERINMRWLYLLMSPIFLSRFTPLICVFCQKESLCQLTQGVIMIIPIIQYVLITYNLISSKYLIINSKEEVKKSMPEDLFTLNHTRFQRYIRDKKPYLDPKLRITDVAAALNTNRSYVSSFINKEYGMNFCRFINRLRLEELDKLRALPENRTCSNLELVLLAGFSSYRSYLRINKEENKLGLMRMFK